ncbi:MAG: ABC transporter substrate-binding protein [Streptosporangiales bacterium]|nr:ABC transporter substrate-binding protein [Streptosporangiales bacterium]
MHLRRTCTSRRRAPFGFVTAVTLALSAALLPACSPPTPGSSGTGGKDTLTLATNTGGLNLNPMLGVSRTDQWITSLMYPSLLELKTDGSFVPSLATKWGYENPLKAYVEIRDDMRWSDGTPLTADDVAFTFNATKKHKIVSGLAYAYARNTESAKAVSKTRVEFTLARPDRVVLEVGIGFWMKIVPKHVFSKVGDLNKFTNNKDWVSAGPYNLTKVVPGYSYTLERVTPFPLAPSDTPIMKTINYRVYPDVNSEILALRNGEVDAIANPLPPVQSNILRKTEGLKIVKVPGIGFTDVTFNMKRKPFNSVLVRKAFAHAIDNEDIRKTVFQGQARSTHSGPIPASLEKYFDPSLKEYEYDPELSRRLMRKAGFKADEDGMFPGTYELIYSLQDIGSVQMVDLIKESAAKAGLRIKPRGMERNTWLAKRVAGDFDIYTGNFGINFGPGSLANLLLPGGPNNFSFVNDPSLTAQVQKALTTSGETQVQTVHAISKRVHDEVIDDVIMTQDFYYAYSSALSGFIVRPSDVLSIVTARSIANVKRTTD